jgi:hypothetical protein
MASASIVAVFAIEEQKNFPRRFADRTLATCRKENAFKKWQTSLEVDVRFGSWAEKLATSKSLPHHIRELTIVDLVQSRGRVRSVVRTDAHRSNVAVTRGPKIPGPRSKITVRSRDRGTAFQFAT